MGYRMTREQEDMQKLVRDFAQNRVKPYVMEHEEAADKPYELIQEGFDLGIHLIDVPEEYGGLGLGLKTRMICSEEMAKVDTGFATAFNGLGLKCVLAMGNEEQKKRACELLIPGAPSAFCLTEPQSGSDASNMKTTAVRKGDNYIINGSKCFITGGAIAKLYIVMAVTDKTKGSKGISAFMVEAGTPGLSIGKEENKMGIRLSSTCTVNFDDMVVPAANMLGEEGTGYAKALAALDSGRIGIAVNSVGIAQRALEEAVKYSKERICFGKPIGKFEGIEFMLADMATKIEAARKLVEYAIDLYEEGKPYIKAASMAKMFASDVAMSVTTDAVQILGGYGYCKDYPVEKFMRDAKAMQIVEGTNQIQRMILGKMLFADPTNGAVENFITE